jgi:hypothetical protein
MQDPYQTEPYVQDEYPEPQPKRRMSGWLIALIVILVLIVACCCLIFFGYLLLAPSVGNTFSTIIETLEAFTPVPPTP